jgi:ketosteroid isomerase-like protein
MTATTDAPAVPADLLAALDRVADALTAMFTGDPAPYAALWAPGAQPTLYGAWGPIEKGHEALMRTFTWVGSRFSDGVACRPRYEVVDCSGDLAYTVGFEEGEVRVDGGPLSTMTLRVTHVLRRVDGEWRLVHRHADFPPRDQRR